jgi:hypothetical protein
LPITNKDQHPLAGQQVKLKLKKPLSGVHDMEPVAYLEDWWDRIANMSWKDANGNPAAMLYGMRAGMAQLPLDDYVVYVKINGLGHIVHTVEIVG